MAVDQLNFQGINRAVSDYGNAGACEELINLRPTTAGLVPVKPFTVKFSGVTYGRLYEHKASGVVNYMTIDYDGELHFYVGFRDSDNHQIGTIEDINIPIDYYPNFSLDDVHFASAGNYVLVSICDKEDNYVLNLYYLWNGTSYVKKQSDDVNVTLTPSISALNTISTNDFTAGTTHQEFVDATNSAFNKMVEENKDTCFGPILIAAAYKTTDGNVFWTTKWVIADPVPSINGYRSQENTIAKYKTDEYIPGTTYEDAWPAFYDVHDYGYEFYSASRGWFLSGGVVSLNVKISAANYDAESSMLRSVEIYASRPKLFIDPSYLIESRDGLTYDDYIRAETTTALLPQVPIKEMELEKELLYFQKSIPLSELKDAGISGVDITLEFGGNIQTTNQTLDVDAGAVTHYGNILSYNNRFHFYDGISKTDFKMPFISSEYSILTYEAQVFILFNDGKKDTLVYTGETEIHSPIKEIIASSIRAREVWVYTRVSGSIGSYTLVKYPMTESSSYNFSIYVRDKDISGTSVSPSDVPIPSQEDDTRCVFVDEPDAINVTEQYNPFVFKVDHSYLAPGKVLDLQPQMVAVTDVSYGDYPLNVFTDRGVYALLQGSGTVLYGNLRQVSNLVSNRNSVPTESGTFFIAAGGLWAVAGAKASLISDALSLGPHKYIRTCPGYQAISEGVYDVKDYVSDPIFEKYVKKATLSYNRFRDELIISNPEEEYSYVLSLKYKQWFKIDVKLSQDVIGSGIACTPSGTTKDVLDFSDEDENASVLVHLQSRPFSIGYQYVHIHRVLAMIRANLSASEQLVVALYGSDDLQNWKLLSYADRSNVQFSQIRTPSAARSWRYYTVCIGGHTPTDTDFGTVMFEYEPVMRRIG